MKSVSNCGHKLNEFASYLNNSQSESYKRIVCTRAISCNTFSEENFKLSIDTSKCLMLIRTKATRSLFGILFKLSIYFINVKTRTQCIYLIAFCNGFLNCIFHFFSPTISRTTDRDSSKPRIKNLFIDLQLVIYLRVR